MSKSFWEGFFEGFYKTSAIINPFLIAVLIMLYHMHPYEQCKRKYEVPNDIMECVWILENETD